MERQNVTLSLPKALLRKAKAVAAEEDKSLSEFIRESLDEKIKKDTGYEEAMERQIRLMKKGFDLGIKGRIKWTREELHERR
ncbi:MAG: ribbon-helix-helix protein, CopG family [Nitrospirae bacterium]|nr:ribbon-helix-helix protein, CopG family [Nitrospirota bacterium]